MSRKGWQHLSDAYRNRLIRNGVSQADYERGTSLGKARGHETPTGASERVWEQLVKEAKRATWPKGFDVKDSLENELAKGTTPDELSDAIRLKIAAQRAYKNEGREAAAKIWQRRNPLHSREIYWYHVPR